MNEAFDAVMNVQNTTQDDIRGKELSLYNLIDLGIITSVNDGRCSVQSYKIVNGMNLVYTDLELVYPGGTGSYNPEGMSCIVFFPAESTSLKEHTISSLKPYFSIFGGKVMPVSVDTDCAVKVGPSSEGYFSLESDEVSVTIENDDVLVLIDSGKMLNLFCNKDSMTISMLNNNLIIYEDTVNNKTIKAKLTNDVPLYYECITSSEHWIGHSCFKAMSDGSINYDIKNYVKTDFNFVESLTASSHIITVYNNSGTALCTFTQQNNGTITITTDETVTLNAKKDVTVNRDGTKLEVKSGKVIVTGDLEVSGKTTITGMKTDIQKFFDDLTSALNSMYTLGSPATHQTDGGFKSNIITLRSKL